MTAKPKPKPKPMKPVKAWALIRSGKLVYTFERLKGSEFYLSVNDRIARVEIREIRRKPAKGK